MDSIDWNSLCQYASELHGGVRSTVDPKFTMGGRHVVRIINFEGGERWIARLRMTTDMDDDEQCQLVQREVDCIQLVRERTSVPVPAVYGYIASAKKSSKLTFPSEFFPVPIAFELRDLFREPNPSDLFHDSDLILKSIC